MKRQITLGLALVMAIATTSVEAQLGGLLKKKAREAIGGKKEEPPPAPAAAPETEKPAAPASAPTRGSDAAGAGPAAKKAASPLEESELPVRQSANQVLRGDVRSRPNGDWEQLPYIPSAAVVAAHALGASAQVALVESVGTALKSMVMSGPFLAEHEKYVKNQHHGVDHGLKGLRGIEDALKKNDLKAIEAIQARETVANMVDSVRSMPANYVKVALAQDVAGWKKDAGNPTRRDRAKFQKLVARAEPLDALDPKDEKFLRGYAVLKSIENDGPDTEEAVFAIHERVTQEREQIAYDTYNLKGQLKQHLATFVAVAPKVNFTAPTAMKNGMIRFVNPADEKQGALWKACFRAGEGPTAAALKFARGWLAEL
jgi:hypothetical protein